ncbi:helix-turn-helix domain-containing protein [Lysinibacillus sp. FW12]|uniref:helix-turn-helix domain-containing protein n=1 Tax=Lysinibacillus sp. FW12 TaxID=3096079 RepID=UPI003D762A32
MTIKITLNETLENTSLTRNAIAVKAGIRPATLHELVNNKTKGITFETLSKILNAMNELDTTRTYDIKDIFIYKK